MLLDTLFVYPQYYIKLLLSFLNFMELGVLMNTECEGTTPEAELKRCVLTRQPMYFYIAYILYFNVAMCVSTYCFFKINIFSF